MLDEKFEDLESIIVSETGCSWKKIVTALFLGWLLFSQFNEYQDNIFDFDGDFLSENEFKSVLTRYASNYNEIKESPLGRQVFYTKPYVITQNNNLVSVSSYLNLFIYEHSILWIIRDYYQKKNDRAFTSFFGRCFEKYFEELLQTYLSENEFEKIPEQTVKRADWKIEVDEFKFLIEQKSTIIRLSVKQQETNIEDLKTFAKMNVLKAVRQLYNTEKDFNDGKYIKIVLLYDDYLNPEIMEQFLSLPECKVEKDNYYWLMTIEEAERLFSLCKDKRDIFRIIIEEKINRELKHSIEGKSIGYLLDENGIYNNEYLQREKIWSYREYASNTVMKIIHSMKK